MVPCVRMSGVQSVQAILLNASDTIFDCGGELSPVLSLCGIPLALVRTHAGLQRQPRTNALNNQAATYFMIPPTEPPMAPAAWQWNVGEVTLVRRDRRPLTESHFFLLWDFFCSILDKDEPGERQLWYSPRAFRKWIQRRYPEADKHEKMLPW